MSYVNPYGAEFQRKDHPKRVANQVKQYRGTDQGEAKVLGKLLSIVVILGAVVSLIIGQ